MEYLTGPRRLGFDFLCEPSETIKSVALSACLFCSSSSPGGKICSSLKDSLYEEGLSVGGRQKKKETLPESKQSGGPTCVHCHLQIHVGLWQDLLIFQDPSDRNIESPRNTKNPRLEKS
jgi:hypothetical protein